MNAKTAVYITITVLITATVTYFTLQPGVAADESPHTTPMAAGNSQDPGKIASVAQLVSGLQARLEEDPDDAKGWMLLAKSYDHLGDNSKALAAYQRAVALGMSDSAMEMKLVVQSFDEGAAE